MSKSVILGLGLLAAGVLGFGLSQVSVGADTATAAPADANVAVALKAVALLDKCSACHAHGWYEQPGMKGKKTLWGQDVPRLIKEKLVVPGKPDDSRLYAMAKGGHHPENATARPTADDVKVFGQWIAAGCLNPAAGKAASQPASGAAAR
jgi:hypothetical protein